MKYILISCILILSLSLIGCDSNDASDIESEIEEIAILPNSASIAVGDEVGFSVVALSATGDTLRDANLNVTWWSTDDTVFEVEDNGLAVARNAGTAYCMVEVAELAKFRRFTGKDSVFVTVF